VKKTAMVSLSAVLMSQSLMALEIPDGNEVHDVVSSGGALVGYLDISESPSAPNRIMKPVHVFADVSYTKSLGEEAEIDLGGIAEDVSVVLTSNTDDDFRFLASVCFSQPIPVNASVLVQSAVVTYSLEDIVIPEGRIDRYCAYMPYFSAFNSDGSRLSRAEFSIILDE